MPTNPPSLSVDLDSRRDADLLRARLWEASPPPSPSVVLEPRREADLLRARLWVNPPASPSVVLEPRRETDLDLDRDRWAVSASIRSRSSS